MRTVLITPPAIEPVTLSQAKLHARVDASADDDLVSALIVSARTQVEGYLQRALITQILDFYLDVSDSPFKEQYSSWAGIYTPTGWFPTGNIVASARRIRLSVGGAQSISAFKYYTADNTETDFDVSNYRLTTDMVVLNDNCFWPTVVRQFDSARIRITAGYGTTAASVPQPIKQAILMLIAHLYENRGALMDPMNNSGAQLMNMPFSVTALLAPYKRYTI